jgi:hypothetical protein
MMSTLFAATRFLCHPNRRALPFALACYVLMNACGDDAEQEQGGGDTDASATVDAGVPLDSLTTGDARPDGDDAQRAPAMCSGNQLFGRPNATTGLDSEQCTPFCADCGEQGFEARTFSTAEIEQLRAWRLAEPFAEITSDPYLEESPEIPPFSVCGLQIDPQQSLTYRLQTFTSTEEAVAAGAEVTHGGVCGVCSTLENLAVYVQNEDLTAPVRQCGLDGISNGKDANIACLQELGFDLPCAQIWYFNTENTRNSCFEPCIAALNEAYHLPDGSLNACLQCDEENSGPIFKAIAGRTRRNSGLANALCRPCSEVMPLQHTYADVVSGR